MAANVHRSAVFDDEKEQYGITFTAVEICGAASRHIYPIFYEAGALVQQRKVF